MHILITPVDKTDFEKLLVLSELISFITKDGKCFAVNEGGNPMEIEETFDSIVEKLAL